MEKQYYPHWQETLYRHTLPNGLTILVVPRPGFTRKLCYFVTDYGAIHREFSLDGQAISSPAGVAHYLEHKMFDLPDRDVSAEFAALGATPNAFTSYDMTAYYFSCTDHFESSLKILLEFVSTPYFTEQSVAKEQGIIAQEIDMHADDPESRNFELLMEAMYQSHPIRTPILGTRQSISQITPQVLTDCHKAFYRPGNMVLCVVGDVDPEAVVRIAQTHLPDADPVQVTRREQWPESLMPQTHLVEATMEVSMPMFQLGFKCHCPGRGRSAVRQEVIGDLAAEALYGESSALYLTLYEEGLIDGSFGGGYETIDGMAMLLCSGDSDHPEQVRQALLDRVQVLCREGICEKDFLRMKRSALGRRIRDLDSFDSVCFRLCAYHFDGYDYFSFPEIYQEVTVQDVLEFLRIAVTEERSCLCVINPKKVEE